jgi:hypothetical protein
MEERVSRVRRGEGKERRTNRFERYCRCVEITPFGSEVVPEVKKMVARSCRGAEGSVTRERRAERKATHLRSNLNLRQLALPVSRKRLLQFFDSLVLLPRPNRKDRLRAQLSYPALQHLRPLVVYKYCHRLGDREAVKEGVFREPAVDGDYYRAERVGGVPGNDPVSPPLRQYRFSRRR